MKTPRGWKTILAGSLVASAAFLTYAITPAPALAQKETTLTGIIGDTRCGNAHENSDSRACVIDCVKHMNAYYALIIGQRSYMLQGKTALLEPLAGQKAKVTGILRSDSFMVTSASPAQ